MSSSFLPRNFIVYALCLPLAVLVGFLLIDPLRFKTLMSLAGLLFLLFFPMLMRWHHALLIVSWNAAVLVFFLPGTPSLWMVLAVMSLFFAVLKRTLSKKSEFMHVPSVAIPLIFIFIVMMVTAYFTGGIGVRALGSAQFGGKRYLSLFAGILGFFALISQPIPREKAAWYTMLFFLSGLTAMASNIAYALGPAFQFLFAFFPAMFAGSHAQGEVTFVRLAGVSFAAQAAQMAMLCYFGIRGLVDLRKPWRLGLFTILVVASLLGGFRSTLVLLIFMVGIQFYLEGLFRSRLFPISIMAGVVLMMFMLVFIDKMPLAIQRSLSFLPIDVDPRARLDAMSTVDWRLQMWKVLIPEIPKYFWFGKGFSFSGTDLYLTEEAVTRGFYTAYESTLINGNYHNGILTIIIPFGIYGIVGFVAFCWGAYKVLYNNWKHGDPELERINTFLLAIFSARLLFYLIFYGQFDLDLPAFIGLVGLSISLNHGVKQPAPEPVMPFFSARIMPAR